MTRMSPRAWLLVALLLLSLAFAPSSPALRAQSDGQPGVERIADGPQVDTLAAYVVEVLDKVQRYHPQGDELDRQALLDGARDAVIEALARKPDLPADQRDTLLAWMREQQFTSVTQLLQVLHDFSAVYTPLNMTAVADTAAQGILAATEDPFSRLMTLEELQRLQQQMMSPEDRSLGIAPEPIPTEDGSLRLKVSHIRRGYLGFEMGLRPGDEIVALDGTPVAEIPREAVAGHLQADLGEQVSITIRREGFDEPITVHGTQRSLSRPAATGRMLPGDIGYVATNMFSMDFHTVVRQQVQRFVDRGAVALILDLRNNPGGAMNACTAVADDFLPQGEVITYTKGTYRNPFGFIQQLLGLDDGERVDDETTVYRAGNPQRFTLPLIVLVNGMSASASEMLSGALKSHERAVIVGETTYGKGIGQTAVMLSNSPSGSGGGGLLGMFMGGGQDMRMLFMTVMTYFGPNNEPVHEIGVEPNVVAPEARPDAEIFDRVAALRASGAVDAYLERVLGAHDAFFQRQVLGAPAPLAEYPNVAALREHEAAAELSDETLAREIRHALRRHLEVSTNLADDNQLQVAILEAAKLARLDLEGVEEYRHFGD